MRRLRVARFTAFAGVTLVLAAAVQGLADRTSPAAAMQGSADRTSPPAAASGGAATDAATVYGTLTPNRWVELEALAAGLPAFRVDHGGAVYDSHRNSVFLFGSDEHLRGFDNRMRELRIGELEWRAPYARSPRYTLRTNDDGVRVAGGSGRLPWPMHIYDSMVYDPAQRSIVVLSGPKHSFIPAPGAQIDATWAYRPGENAWHMLSDSPDTPNFFAAGAVYDPTRDAIVAYAAMAEQTPFVPLAGESEIRRNGVWELGPDRRTWRLASPEQHHWGWFNVEFDVANRAMLVFGGTDSADPSISVYRVGAKVGDRGRWERRRPEGDHCPGGYYFPAAYDGKRQLTLFMPFDREAGRTVSCVYDAASNVARRLPEADLPYVALDYTMVYVEKEDFFLLVTGGFSRGERTRVWALRLDASALAP